MTYDLSHLPRSVQEQYEPSTRTDAVAPACKTGNKPCGKICIPQEQKCAIAGEKDPSKAGKPNNVGKIVALGAAGVVSGVAGYAALKYGKEAYEKRKQQKLEGSEDQEADKNPKKTGPDVQSNAPDEKMKSAKLPKKKEKQAKPPSQEAPQAAPDKEKVSSPMKNAGILSRLNPFKRKEVPTSGSAKEGKERLLANKKNALDKESRRKKIYNNVDESIGARSARKVAGR